MGFLSPDTRSTEKLREKIEAEDGGVEFPLVVR